ncbi:MAG: exodeoxyribonuclease V subunit alpha, partial [Desulfobacteraceae bacterium]|nr:exodeoxyribonuclease V subunit alpha [Desulfobacteraceae bacterium]
MREIDFHFARFISGLCPHDDPDIFMGAALVSNAAGNGDIYLDLALSAGKPLGEGLGAESRLRCPQLNAWTEKLHASPVVGSPGELRPLILDKKNRLYLYRYWDYEKRLADLILKRAQEHIGVIDESLLRNSLQRLFPEASDNGIDWQKVAALAATLNKFCLISGGPGTGKTFTVAKILALLLEQAGNDRLEILLAAPTGKAAARLSESIRTAKKTLNCRKDISDAIPSESYTIHRLLKTIPGSPYFIHNSENRLPADVVVVDEASMIDLALMSKLIEAIPATARLILIGDKDQLASVEAGSVLGDICDRNRVHGFSERFCKRLEKITGEEFNVGIEHDSFKNGLQDCIVV